MSLYSTGRTRMRSTPFTPETDPASEQSADLTPEVTRILSQPPQVQIPTDFAARVASQATAQPVPHAAHWIGWGPRLTLGSGALLTVALFALAPHASPSLTNLPFDVELLLFAELGTLLLFATRLLRQD